MDFTIPSLPVPSWKNPGQEPNRGMNDQLWEVLESLDGSGEIGALMQGIRLIDDAVHPDRTIDSEEWQQIAEVLRAVLGPEAPAASPDRAERIYSAFELRAAELKR